MSFANAVDLSGLLAGPNLGAGVGANPYGASYLAQMGLPTGSYGSFAGGPTLGIPSTLPGAGGALPADLAAQYGAATSAPAAAAGAAGGTGLPAGATVADYMAGGAGAATAAATPYAGWLGGTLSGALTSAPGLLGKAGGIFAGPAGPAITGWAATQGLNKLLPSTGTAGNWREVLADAATGAGLAGSVGAVLAPATGGLSVPIAAGGGAILGAGYGLLNNLGVFGDSGSGTSDKDLRSTLEANAKMMGLSPSDYTSKFDLATKAGMTDAKGNKLSNQDIANYLGSQMSSEVATTRAQNQSAAQALEFHKADLASNQNLALQSQAFMQPYQNNIISSGINQAQVLNKLADQMPGQYKGVFQAQAATALNQSQQMAAAYAGQTALQPSMQILNNYQQQQQQQQAQQNQAMTLAIQMQKAQAGGGAGGVNFATLGQSTTGPNAAAGITGGVPGIGMLGGYG